MPDERSGLGTSQTEISGKVYGDPASPPQQGGLFGAGPAATLFNVETDGGQMVRCQFRGQLNAMLRRDDRIIVRGFVMKGVLYARLIVDQWGTEIGRAQCVVATAAFADPWAREVEILRQWRDLVLSQCSLGRALVAWYWRAGPRMAAPVSRSRVLRAMVRLALLPVCAVAAIAVRRVSKPKPAREPSNGREPLAPAGFDTAAAKAAAYSTDVRRMRRLWPGG